MTAGKARDSVARELRLDEFPSPMSIPPLDSQTLGCTKKKKKGGLPRVFLQVNDSTMPALDGMKSQKQNSPQNINEIIVQAIDSSFDHDTESISIQSFRDILGTHHLDHDMKSTMLLEMLATVQSTHLPRVRSKHQRIHLIREQEILHNAWIRIVQEEQQDIFELTTTPPRSPQASPQSTVRPSTSGGNPKLSLAKSKRKQAEYDAKLLSNRLALLQQEELKAWKKIEQTREKAQQILQHREIIVKKQQDKYMLLHEKEEIIRTATKKHQIAAKTSVIRKRQATISVISKKYQEVENVKMERRRLKEEKEQQVIQEILKAKEKRQRIRKQEEQMRKKRLKEKNIVEKKIVARYQKDVIEEEERLKQQKLRVAEMERAEMELIQRLQSTQLLQRQAYDELEKALIRSQV